MYTCYSILLIIFIVTAVNYAYRAVAVDCWYRSGKRVAVKRGFDGLHLSAFGGPICGCKSRRWLLDKFGSKKVRPIALSRSLFTFLQGFVDMFLLAWAGIMFFMRFMLASGSAITSGECLYRFAAWLPDERTWYCSSAIFNWRNIPLALFASAWLADFRLGLGARLYRYGGDRFCADGAVVLNLFRTRTLPMYVCGRAEVDPEMARWSIWTRSWQRGSKRSNCITSSNRRTDVRRAYLRTRSLYQHHHLVFLTWFPIDPCRKKGMSILKWVWSPLFRHCGVFAGRRAGGVLSDYLINVVHP